MIKNVAINVKIKKTVSYTAYSCVSVNRKKFKEKWYNYPQG